MSLFYRLLHTLFLINLLFIQYSVSFVSINKLTFHSTKDVKRVNKHQGYPAFLSYFDDAIFKNVEKKMLIGFTQDQWNIGKINTE